MKLPRRALCALSLALFALAAGGCGVTEGPASADEVPATALSPDATSPGAPGTVSTESDDMIVIDGGDGCYKECYEALYMWGPMIRCRWKCDTICPDAWYRWWGDWCDGR